MRLCTYAYRHNEIRDLKEELASRENQIRYLRIRLRLLTEDPRRAFTYDEKTSLVLFDVYKLLTDAKNKGVHGDFDQAVYASWNAIHALIESREILDENL